METFVLLAMIFCHILDDFCLQGISLSNLKQKRWWNEHVTSSKLYRLYRYDYLAALIAHAFSWSFMILLPVVVYKNFNIDSTYIILISINLIIHSCVDDLKANRDKINLIVDQSIHLVQITISYILLMR